MPYQDPDPTDPMTLRGVVVETGNDAATREMASCFISEFLSMGFDRTRLINMFKHPGYAGPNMAYRELGEAAVVELIDQHLSIRGHRIDRAGVVKKATGQISLPVLNR